MPSSVYRATLPLPRGSQHSKQRGLRFVLDPKYCHTLDGLQNLEPSYLSLRTLRVFYSTPFYTPKQPKLAKPSLRPRNPKPYTPDPYVSPTPCIPKDEPNLSISQSPQAQKDEACLIIDQNLKVQGPRY